MSARDDVCPLCRERPVEMEMEGRVLVCRPCGEVLFWLAPEDGYYGRVARAAIAAMREAPDE